VNAVAPLLVRTARPDDAPEVAALLVELGYPENGVEQVRRRLTVWIEEDASFALVGERERHIVGAVAVTAIPYLERDGRFGRIVALVVAAGVIAVWLAQRARAGSPRRLAATALGLSIAAAATYVAFWSGWPHVFGAVAVVLAIEYRRRVGSFAPTTIIALSLGAIALVAAAITCVFG